EQTTLRTLETAIDVALLDTKSEVCVLRGGKVEHPRYAGKRLFGAGINLTHLYQGKIRYLWYLLRDLGLVNKIYRGLAVPNASPVVESREEMCIGGSERIPVRALCPIVFPAGHVAARDRQPGPW